MHKENMLKVAESLEGIPATGRIGHALPREVPSSWNGPGISMWAWLLRGSARTVPSRLDGECGTVGCLAGHTVCTLDPENKLTSPGDTIEERAAELLGLSLMERDWLFRGYPDRYAYDIDGEDCADVLREAVRGTPIDRAWSMIKEQRESAQGESQST